MTRRSVLVLSVQAVVSLPLFTNLSLVSAQEIPSLLDLAQSHTPLFASSLVTDGPFDDAAAGPFTFLAPTDAALGSLSSKYLTPQWSDYLQALLGYHVLTGGAFSAEDFKLDSRLRTLLPGDVVKVTETDPITTFNYGSKLVEGGNHSASNGILHVIDSVLVPPAADMTLLDHLSGSPEFSMFLDYLVRFDLTSILEQEGPMTLLIPTNEAFLTVPNFLLRQLKDEGLRQIMLHHIITDIAFAFPLASMDENERTITYPTMQGSPLDLAAGGVVGIASFAGLGKDVIASNGIWHSIDNVLLPLAEAAEPTLDVAQAVSADSNLSELTKHLQDDGLLSTLGLDGPFTLLAPTNSAFFKAPVSVILRAMSAEARLEVLKYHILPGLIKSEDMEIGAKITTLQGNVVVITSSGPVTVNNIGLSPGNTEAKNGIIYYIDEVMFPFLTDDSTTAPTSRPVTAQPTLMPTSASPSIKPATGAPVTDVPTTPPQSDPTPPPTDAPLTEAPTVSPSVSSPIETISELVVNTEELSFLEIALFNTGLEETLLKPGPYTFFAPNNAAWNSNTNNFDGLLIRQQILVMTYHVVPGLFTNVDLTVGLELETLEGQILTVSETGMINDATILSSLPASNGVIHIIDMILAPPSTMEPTAPAPQPTLSSPTTVPVTQADAPSTSPVVASTTRSPKEAEQTISPSTAVTVLPTYEGQQECDAEVQAFAGKVCCPIKDRSYRSFCVALFNRKNPIVVNPGVVYPAPPTPAIAPIFQSFTRAPRDEGSPTIAAAQTKAPTTVVKTAAPTVQPSDGTKLSDLLPTSAPTGPPAEPTETISEVIISTEELSFLEIALFNTGVEETLLKPGPYTFFAPNNAAWNSNTDNFDGLLTRQQILVMTYHVVPGLFTSEDLAVGLELETLEGQILTVLETGMINDATILSSLPASNGVIHIIDMMLTPPSEKETTTPTSEPTVASTVGSSGIQANVPSASPVVVSTTQAPKDEATGSPTTPLATETPTADPVTMPPTFMGQQECDAEVQAFAGKVCCPIKDRSYRSFCVALFNRENPIVVNPGVVYTTPPSPA